MATQTERQSTIVQNSRTGTHKNSRSLHRRGMGKTAGANSVAFGRSTNLHQKAARDLHHRDAETVCVDRRVPSEEFTASEMQMIFRTAYRITRNREDAEDAMQDAYLRAILHLQHFDGRSKFSTWLTRIAINSSLMILRKRRNARITSLNNAVDFEESKKFQRVQDLAPDVEKHCLQKERETALREEINTLRPSHRRVIELAHLDEWSLRDIAEVLGLSVSAVKARLFHARRKLRNSRRLRPFLQQPAKKQARCLQSNL